MLKMPSSMPPYLDPYQQSLELYGAEFDVTLWASPETQRRRFQVFTELVDLTGERVLDAGCSRGDFAEYLIERGIAYQQYIGIDGLPELIRCALDKELARCEFLAGDFLQNPSLLATGHPSVICISGSLNTMLWEEALAVLDHAWKAAGRALVFNFLSSRCGPAAPVQDTYARRHDTMRLFDWALERTADVQFRQDYFRDGHDASIAMRKRA